MKIKRIISKSKIKTFFKQSNRFISNDHSNPNFNIDTNKEIAKKQLYWRIRNIGQREIELLILNWYEKHIDNLSIKELNDFNNEVINMNNLDMNRFFVKLESVPDEKTYTKMILDNSINIKF